MLERVDQFDPSGQPLGGRIVLHGDKYLDNAAQRLAATLGNSKPEAVRKMKEYLEDMVSAREYNSGFGESVVKTIRKI
jgi:4-aminobutyrate aminotransferase-like enzyme